jgi:hypothetical protein
MKKFVQKLYKPNIISMFINNQTGAPKTEIEGIEKQKNKKIKLLLI